MTDMHREALFRGRAQDEEPRVRHICDMGVGCEEAGICYAEDHGEPVRCGKQTIRYMTEQNEQRDSHE